ncbi:MAG TPA: aconitate hydratase AcnA [Candidatus Binatia bacterium]|nr:aconitate hydratase AcnA [Candidatus Binatia bacterium]
MERARATVYLPGMAGTTNTFSTRDVLAVGGSRFTIYRLDALGDRARRLPVSLKVLLENLLRLEDGRRVCREHIEALLAWDPKRQPEREVPFMPARVLLQDFTGVPAVVDLAAMRDAVRAMGGDPTRINPLQPVDLVIDHSVVVDVFGSSDAFRRNVELEFERNRERYAFLRWGQQAFRNFRVVPPDTGIVHQVNIEYLAPVVVTRPENGMQAAFPDTVLGTDSHTTMVNGLGVVGWGVGGIEAEAAMLGQPTVMLIPQVIGFRLDGALPAGATATDAVLTVTEMLRKKGVVGKFVEFYGPGVASLGAADRTTIANMAPEYGATIGFFPIDGETLAYLRLTGRDPALVELVEAYARAQGLFRADDGPEPAFSDTLTLDLGTVEPSLAGPRRPQDRVPLKRARSAWREALCEFKRQDTDACSKKEVDRWLQEGGQPLATIAPTEKQLGPLAHTEAITMDGHTGHLGHGAVVIAAITSCTNTSNPSVMLGAGILARKAAARGLGVRPWVKTSLAPGSKVVTRYLTESGLLRDLERLGFALVGYGCTTCIGNSGPLPEPVADAIGRGELVAAAVLSGNRNFEGRINALVRANYLASPPLVVAYALAGTIDYDPEHDPLGHDRDGNAVFLRDLWPTPDEIAAARRSVEARLFREEYARVTDGDERWRALPVPAGEQYRWDPASTYIKLPPFFVGMRRDPDPVGDVRGARVLALLGDSVTTDHISPAGSIPKDTPAGRYLIGLGVKPADFNSYGARRGNHEVMLRGTFANIRLRNQLVPGVEGGWTVRLPDGERMTIYDAAMRYRAENVPLVVIAGKEYGTGSSRDWAAKGTLLLGVRAVLAQSYERIHRSNLVGMGVLPLEFLPGENATSLGLSGRETYDLVGIADGLRPGARVTVRATDQEGRTREFQALARVDTADDVEYYRHGGLLPYVLRGMLRA